MTLTYIIVALFLPTSPKLAKRLRTFARKQERRRQAARRRRPAAAVPLVAQ
jgi:hypothetical protein